MTTATVARPKSVDAAHWYTKDGKPCHEVAKKDGSGLRATTLADARKHNLLPSVTSICGILDKPQLTNWKIEQAVLACMTAPKRDGESIDQFVERVLQEEEQHRQESKQAMDVGSEIHAAIASSLRGESYPAEYGVYVHPVLERVGSSVLQVETVLTHKDGYAGTCDAIFVPSDNRVVIRDWKTAKNLPKKDGYAEHHLQLAAYAAAFLNANDAYQASEVSVENIYISTTEPGKIHVCTWPEWKEAYEAFFNLLGVWQWQKDYIP